MHPTSDPRTVSAWLTTAAVSAALQRDGHARPEAASRALASLPEPVARYLTAVAEHRDPGPLPELPEPFDAVFRDLFAEPQPLRHIALQLTATLMDDKLSALCASVALLRDGMEPPPWLQPTLDSIAAASDPVHAALGRYLRGLLAGGEPPTPPCFGEPLDTLLAAIFPTPAAT
jgi:hypothetical protein